MNGKQRHFVFVVEPGFTMQAFSSAIEVLRCVRKLRSAGHVSYSVTALEPGPVPASNDVHVVPDLDIAEVPKGATLVVVAGAGVDRKPNAALVARVRRWAREGRAIWAISSGVVRLAQAGLIDGCTVAAHWEDVPYLRENHPKVDISNALFLLDSQHPTCAGGGAAADLFLSYLAANGAADLVDEVASLLMLDGVRDGRMRQASAPELRYATSNRTVFAAIRLMTRSIFEPLAIHDVARLAGVSQRQLERLFNAEFGKPPAKVYRDLRLAEARQDVLSGRRPIVDIALDYGFTAGAFSKVYRSVFGELPSEDRRRRHQSVS